MLALLPACAQPNEPVARPIEEQWEAPPPSPPPVQPEFPLSEPAPDPSAGDSPHANPVPDPSDVIAVVNGSPIARSRMAEMLMESQGLRLLEDLILLTAARQRASKMSLSVTQADVDAAREDALRQLASPIASDAQPLDRAAAERLLDEFLLAKSISRSDWERRMEQRACLRKIAEAEVAEAEITDDDLRKEYALAYGEKVQIRHIQVASVAAVRRVRSLLAEKKNFELVARQLSENQVTAVQGGLLPPFTRDDASVPPLLRETAFELPPGEASAAVREGDWYHILRLERRFPASDVGLENADAEELRRRLIDRRVRQRQDDLQAELFQAATVDIRDPQLARQFRAQHRPPTR